MVEMLEVLAIMGVLSIGGIAGYRYAMAKYQANEILNEVRKRAVIASQQRVLGNEDVSLNEMPSKIINRYQATGAKIDDATFKLEGAKVPQQVCQGIQKQRLLLAQEVQGDCANAEENTLMFVFNNELKEVTTDAPMEANNTFMGVDGEKYDCSEPSSVAVANAEECHKCDNRFVKADPEIYCLSCSDHWNSVRADECHRCEGKYMNHDHACRSCPESGVIRVFDGAECARCPLNRSCLIYGDL